MSFIFLSHSSADNAHALALGRWLEDNGWSKYFLDISETRGLQAGGKWQNELRKASHHCEAVVFVISRPWLESKWCLAEFLLAKQLGKKIFGVLIENIPIPELPTELTSEWQLCDLVNGEERVTFQVVREPFVASTEIDLPEVGLDALRRGLKGAGLEATTFPWPPEHEPDRAPYRGLKPYTADDAAIFFGRDAAIVRGLDLVRQLRDNGSDRMLVILGSSGAGKSSFMRAGLWPRLKRDDHHFHTLPVVRPGRAAINGTEGLAASIAAALGAVDITATNIGDVRSRFRTDLRGGALEGYLGQLREKIMANAAGDVPEPTFILPIDQAEELYASDAGPEAAQLRAQLAAVGSRSGNRFDTPGAPGGGPEVLVLVTIRTDLYSHLQEDELLRDIGRQMIDLTPMDRSEYKHVIEGPARQASEAGHPLVIEPQLTEQLLVDTEGADALPMLAFTLERLYADFGADGELTLREYQELGGITGSLVAAIEAAMDAPERPPLIPSDPVERQRLLRQAFIPWLAEIDEQTGERRRRVALWSELPEATHPMLERLTEARLLIRDLRGSGTDNVQHEVVEVAHEALLRRWPELVNWLDADEGALKMVGVVSRAAEQWSNNGRDDEYVVHAGERLRDAVKLLDREDFSRRLGTSGADYLARCQAVERARASEKQRRQRFLQGALAVSLALAAFATYSYRKADTARAEAQESARIAEAEKDRSARALSLMHANLSRQRTDKGYAIQGALLALEALPKSLDNPERPYVVEAEIALYAALESLQTRRIFRGHDKALVGAEFSPDGKRVVTASEDGTARLWEVSTGRQIALLEHDGPVRRVAFGPNGAWLLTLASDGDARLWDGKRGYPRTRLHIEDEAVDDAAFNPDGTLMATSSGRFVHVWKVASGCSIRVFGYPDDDAARGVAFSHDGSRAVTLSASGRLHLWKEMPDNTAGCADRDAERIVEARWDTTAAGSSAARTGEVSVSFNADDSRILAVFGDDVARLWDAADPESGPLAEFHDVSSAVFSPDGETFLTASGTGLAELWPARGPPRGENEPRALATFEVEEGNLRGAAFSVDGSRLVVVSDTSKARVWDVASGRELAVLEGHWQPIVSANFSSDGTLVVTASKDRTARIHSVRRLIDTVALSGHESAVNSVVFNADGTRLLSASADSTARVWDVDTRREIMRFEGHHNIVVSADFSPDGERVVTASDDGTARVWDAVSGETLVVLDGDGYGFTGAAFSPDGERVATSSWDGTARVWNLPSVPVAKGGSEAIVLKGDQARTYEHGAAVSGAVFDAGGERLVTSSLDCAARVWNLATEDEPVRFDGHEMAVLSAAPNAEGTALVTASLDGTVRVWDMTSSRERLRFKGSEHGFNRAVFSPDGERVITVADIDGVRLWDAEYGTVVEEDDQDESRDVSANCAPPEHGAEHGGDGGVIAEAGAAHAVREDDSTPDRSSTGKVLARLVIESSEASGRCDEGSECSVDINDARFNPDGSKAAVAADDNTVYVWDVLNRRELIDSAHARLLRRELTDGEKARFHVASD